MQEQHILVGQVETAVTSISMLLVDFEDESQARKHYHGRELSTFHVTRICLEVGGHLSQTDQKQKFL